MALYPCPACKKKVSENANACPSCGEPLPTNWYKPAEKKQEISNVIVAVLAILAFGYFLMPENESPKSLEEKAREQEVKADKECRDGLSAFVFSQQFVERNLKSPSSADFPYLSRENVSTQYLGGCRHLIVAYVDAANSFGANIRNYYATIMEYRKSDESWFNYTDTLVIDPDRGSVLQVARVLRETFTVDEPSKRSPPPGNDEEVQASRTRAVQSYLSDLGYDVGSIDGIYGPATGDAIKKFQSEQGLTPDGQVSIELLMALENASKTE